MNRLSKLLLACAIGVTGANAADPGVPSEASRDHAGFAIIAVDETSTILAGKHVIGAVGADPYDEIVRGAAAAPGAQCTRPDLRSRVESDPRREKLRRLARLGAHRLR